MSDYQEMLKPELQKLAGERDLPTSGTKDELVARLQQADAEKATDPDGTLQSLLNQGEGEGAGPSTGDPNPDAAGEGTTQAPDGPAADKEAGQPGSGQTTSQAPDNQPPQTSLPRVGNVVKAAYPVPAGGLDDATHHRLMAEHRQAAAAAGWTTRGTAHRVGWSTGNDGERLAVYEILVR